MYLKARCLKLGGNLATFETLEEAMLMKETLATMKTGIKSIFNVQQMYTTILFNHDHKYFFKLNISYNR